MASTSETGAFAVLDQVFEHVERGTEGSEILALLLPGDQPYVYESELWDYKETLPTPPEKRDSAESELYKSHMAELVKDVVAFFNSFGGYIIAGVSDYPRQAIGFEARFDGDDLNKRVYTATSTEIRSRYSTAMLNGRRFGIPLYPAPARR